MKIEKQELSSFRFKNCNIFLFKWLETFCKQIEWRSRVETFKFFNAELLLKVLSSIILNFRSIWRFRRENFCKVECLKSRKYSASLGFAASTRTTSKTLFQLEFSTQWWVTSEMRVLNGWKAFNQRTFCGIKPKRLELK